jgi:hypothetical protein
MRGSGGRDAPARLAAADVTPSAPAGVVRHDYRRARRTSMLARRIFPLFSATVIP